MLILASTGISDMAQSHPFTTNDLKSWNAFLAKLNDYKAQLDKAESLGLDFSQHRAGADYLEQTVQKMKQVYFPESVSAPTSMV